MKKVFIKKTGNGKVTGRKIHKGFTSENQQESFTAAANTLTVDPLLAFYLDSFGFGGTHKIIATYCRSLNSACTQPDAHKTNAPVPLL